METPVLQAQTRTVTGKQVKLLRKNGQLPAVVYGSDEQNQTISIASGDYNKIFKTAGTSTLVDLVVDNQKPIKVLLHEPQIHPTKSIAVHADFYIVKMTEKLQTEIPLHFVGESDAVTVLDGTLTTQLDALNVECFPDKLVPAIEVDISVLKTFDDIIRIEDIKAPEGMELLHESEEVVATITPPRSEEELAELDEAVTGEDADKAAMEALEVTGEKPEEEKSEE
jgi:large subunit ribosomal protein L25